MYLRNVVRARNWVPKKMINENIKSQEEIYRLKSFNSDIGSLELLPNGEMHAPSILLEIGNNRVIPVESEEK